MTWQSWAYAAIFAAWAIVEAIGLLQKDRPDKPRTLSANLRWLVAGAGPWHHFARGAFVMFLAWFGPHILGGIR